MSLLAMPRPVTADITHRKLVIVASRIRRPALLYAKQIAI